MNTVVCENNIREIICTSALNKLKRKIVTTQVPPVIDRES